MEQCSRRAFALGLVIAITLSMAGAAPAQPQGVSRGSILPRPAGPLSIGRITFHWIDSTRVDSLARAPGAARELMVDVWYPAARTTAPPAPYLPHLATLRRVLPDSVIRRRFAPGYPVMAAGRLSTHAVDSAPVECPREGCPLLLFSHGGGVDRSLYTTQYEDFASHGYVVAAIAHTYLTHTVVFPDGRVARLQDRRSITRSGVDSTAPYWRRRFAESAAINEFRYRHAAADIRFVLDRVTRHAREPGLRSPLLGRLDLRRIGAVGHSMGGLAAAVACREDARIKACMNQDGTDDGLPADRDADGRTLAQPFMYFGRVEPVSTPRADSVLARIQMTRAEDDSIRQARPREQDALLADVAGGAWRIRLRMPEAQHMSFSDELLIEADGDSDAGASALRALTTIHRYSRAFFDSTLLGQSDTLLDRPVPADTSAVRVERFPKR